MVTDSTTFDIERMPESFQAAEAADIAISVRGVGKMYRIYDRPQDRLKQMLWRGRRMYGHEFWALRDVSFDISKGQTFGIIGRNGSGKSTLLQIIAGTLAPTEGQVEVQGRVAALLELGSGFNPDFTGRENVFLNGAILGLSREEMEARFDQIAAFADIGEFIDQPVKIYSSGMVVRLAFAVASCIEPDVLIVDEALAVGDVMFQARCLDKIKQLTSAGATTLFVTHDTGTFQNLCDHGYLLDHGRMFSHGRPAQVALQYYELMRETEHVRQRLAAAPAAQDSQIHEELQIKEEQIRGKMDGGEYRFGSTEAQIVDYRLTNGAGKESSALKVGELFTVSVRVQFYSRVENLALGVMFRNAQGQNLMGMHSFHNHRVDFGMYEAGDSVEISCEQEMLLNPGDYLLSIGIADCRSDYDFTSLDNRSNLTKISVFGKAVSYGLIHTQPRFSFGGQQSEGSIGAPGASWRRDAGVLDYDLKQVQSIYLVELDSSGLRDTLQTILQYSDANIGTHAQANGQEEERAWPGEPRFVETSYYKMMLGRYAFAGSQLCRGANVLDTCCGIGWGAFMVAHYARQVTAFDIEQRTIDFCRDTWQAANIRWLVGDARNLAFLRGQLYDVALGMETIEHFTYTDGAAYIAEVARVLGPEGVFIGTSSFPETEQEAREIQRANPYHLHIFTRSEMIDLLSRHFSRLAIIGNWMFIAFK
jgi:lipopolysaccharide transport system ATP-binding protein